MTGAALPRAARLLGAATLICAVAACAQAPSSPQRADVRMFDYYFLSPAVDGAGEELAKQLAGKVDKEKPLIVSSIVDVSDLDTSSAFGLTLAEQLTARLSAAGFAVRDVKLRKKYAIRDKSEERSKSGEFALSRRLGDLDADAVDTQAFVTGSYAEGGNAVFVSLRVIRATDGRVLAGTEFSLWANRTIKSLLDPRYYWVYRLEEGLQPTIEEERRLRDGRTPGLQFHQPGPGVPAGIERRPLPVLVPYHGGDGGQVTFLRSQPAR